MGNERHKGIWKTSDERQYLITPLLGHQKTDEYMKDKRKCEPETKTESVCICAIKLHVIQYINKHVFCVVPESVAVSKPAALLWAS